MTRWRQKPRHQQPQYSGFNTRRVKTILISFYEWYSYKRHVYYADSPKALTHWGRVTHICVSKPVNYPSLLQIMDCRLASHYLNQCWNIVNWTIGNKPQWNFSLNSGIFIEENAFQSVVCDVAAILSRPQYVNRWCVVRFIISRQHCTCRWPSTAWCLVICMYSDD